MSEFKLGQVRYTLLDDGSHWDVFDRDRWEDWMAQRKSNMLFKTKKEALEAAAALRNDRIFRKRRTYERLGKELEELKEVFVGS